MPNRSEHACVGVLVGGLAALALAQRQGPERNDHGAELLGGLVGGWLGGIMPDVLEPATTPHHREFAHSVALAGASIRLSRLAEWQATCRSRAALCDSRALSLIVGSHEHSQVELTALLWRVLAGALAGFAGGYLSHLALDGMTPRGLPFIAFQ